jgi:hypothetical protein
MGGCGLREFGGERRRARRLPVSVFGAGVLASAVLAAGVAQAVPAAGPGAGTVTVFAGGAGGPGPGRQVALSAPCAPLAVSGGRLLFADAGTGPARTGAVIRELNERTGWLSTKAGIGVPGTRGAGGPASQAELGSPCALAVDRDGNLIMVGTFGLAPVQVIAARSGVFYGVTMKAGHLYVMPGQDRPSPVSGVAVDYAGNLVYTSPGRDEFDPFNASVQVLAVKSGVFYGQQMKAGQLITLATMNDTSIGPVIADAAGNPVFGHDGSMVAIAARSGEFDGRRMRAGHTYQLEANAAATGLDRNGNIVFVRPASAQLDILATRPGRFYGRRMKAGHTYVLAANARFRGFSAVSADQDGNLVAADGSQLKVLAVRPGRFYGISMRAGNLYTVAGTGSPIADSGDGGQPTRAELGYSTAPDIQGTLEFFGAAADQRSDVYLSDNPDNLIKMIAGHPGTLFGQRMHAGDIYTIAGNGSDHGASPGSGGLATKASLGSPQGLAVDHHGNVLITNALGQAMMVRVVAARSGTFYGIAMRAAHIYTIAGGGPTLPVDGTPATQAQLGVYGITVDPQGNVLMGDLGNGAELWVLPARSGTYYGQHMTAGDLYLIAGDGSTPGDGVPALTAALPFLLTGVTTDNAGNIILADPSVRIIAVRTGTFYGQHMTARDIYTLATLPPDARYQGVAVDPAGNVIATAIGPHHVLRVIANRSGTFYGQHMIAGQIYTIAGGGTGLIPANRPGTKIALATPQGVAVLPSGDIVLSELPAGRVLLIHS